ncbi:Histidine--tRNA ligase [compost metagenome]
MANPITAQRGTRDVLPPETALWQLIEDKARHFFDCYHYQEIRTPIFEATELFTRGVGEATDIVSKEMYTFTDRGDRSVTLRPEGTAGVVRAFLQGKLGSSQPLPVKLWYGGAMFRYERPQAGRQRQFHQIGVEALGSSEPKLDAEVITLAIDLFDALGVQGLEVQLNSLGCAECRPRYRETLVAFFETQKADYCETCLTRMDSNPLRVLDCKVPGCRDLNAAAPSLQDVLCEACVTHQSAVMGYLDAVGIRYALNPRLVRGLDYYTRTVFEIVATEKLGSQNTVCAGGRYDGLVEELGGAPTPAVGWAFGVERLAILLGDRIVEPEVDLYLVAMGEEAEKASFKLAHELRLSGVKVELSYAKRKLDKQFAQAERIKATYIGIIGEDEASRGEVRLKQLTTREEQVSEASATSVIRAMGR